MARLSVRRTPARGSWDVKEEPGRHRREIARTLGPAAYGRKAIGASQIGNEMARHELFTARLSTRCAPSITSKFEIALRRYDCWMAEASQWPPRTRMKVQISVASSGPPLQHAAAVVIQRLSSLSEKRIATVASAVDAHARRPSSPQKTSWSSLWTASRSTRWDGRCMLNGRSMVRPYRARPDVGCVAHHHGELLRTDLATNRAWDYYAARAGFQGM